MHRPVRAEVPLSRGISGKTGDAARINPAVSSET